DPAFRRRRLALQWQASGGFAERSLPWPPERTEASHVVRVPSAAVEPDRVVPRHAALPGRGSDPARRVPPAGQQGAAPGPAGAWPVVRFFLAILVLAGLIFVLGLLRQNQGGAPAYDPLGLGLLGGSGALIFLGVVFGGLLGLAGLYLLVTRALSQGAAVDALLL